MLEYVPEIQHPIVELRRDEDGEVLAGAAGLFLGAASLVAESQATESFTATIPGAVEGGIAVGFIVIPTVACAALYNRIRRWRHHRLKQHAPQIIEDFTYQLTHLPERQHPLIDG